MEGEPPLVLFYDWFVAVTVNGHQPNVVHRGRWGDLFDVVATDELPLPDEHPGDEDPGIVGHNLCVGHTAYVSLEIWDRIAKQPTMLVVKRVTEVVRGG